MIQHRSVALEWGDKPINKLFKLNLELPCLHNSSLSDDGISFFFWKMAIKVLGKRRLAAATLLDSHTPCCLGAIISDRDP